MSRLLYPSHKLLSTPQKALVFATSAVRALCDPTRADSVGVVGEVTAGPFLGQMHRYMLQDEDGARILAEKPRISTALPQLNLDELKKVHVGTLGHAYYQFMASHGYSSDDRPVVRFVDNAEHAYIWQRYREVHDFWHVLLGQPPTVLGELTVKWTEWVQTKFPIGLFSGIGSALVLLSPEKRRFLTSEVIPWVVENVPVFQKNMLCIPYESMLTMPLTQIRDMYNIHPAPVHPSEVGA
ncbi:mitochondrial ubiquinone biosynthesis Coq4 [Andalucia godoyi]|uniref:Ubiquinone biosynthesis protein COQ4 homolog, mitochondrial n=1 Tax=Andalucia godoyi TaxID=505711 RepID=A0A8K0AI90_ANDGO|nr:mitochondrial ubiquinone biosynthesis Coq4 [Andalucia godoyi]|eukprot:ANDGO_05214.mRNA.1 mitochondrial ubiquinone biosynthesis Coq4